MDPLRDIRKALSSKGGGGHPKGASEHKKSPPRPKKDPPHKVKTPPKMKATPPQSLEALRAERLRREMEEGARERALLGGLRGGQRGGGPGGGGGHEEDDRKRPYNAQFHPQLARGGRGR